MKLGGIPQSPVEVMATMLGLLPQPLLETQIAMLLARTIMEGSRLGVFEALKDQPLTAEEVAARCGAQPRATGQAPQRARRLRIPALSTPAATPWPPSPASGCSPDAPQSLHDKMLMQFFEWDFLAHLGDFVRTGKPLDLHTSLSSERLGALPAGDAGDRLDLGAGGGEADAGAEGGEGHARHRRLARPALGRHLPPPPRPALGGPRSARGGGARRAPPRPRGHGGPRRPPRRQRPDRRPRHRGLGPRLRLQPRPPLRRRHQPRPGEAHRARPAPRRHLRDPGALPAGHAQASRPDRRPPRPLLRPHQPRPAPGPSKRWPTGSARPA